MSRRSVQEIASIIGNPRLAKAIDQLVTGALASPFVHLVSGRTAWDIFKRSLDAAIRDIEQDTRGRGEMFRRLVEHGPHYPGEPEAQSGAGDTLLSDVECAVCVEFIFSHMVNRFKGELAELLALEPCLALLQDLRKEPQRARVQLYWGETVQERRRRSVGGAEPEVRWGSFAKGADGLLVEEVPGHGKASQPGCRVHGIVEVKSMPKPSSRLLAQIDRHARRLMGGVKLADRVWASEHMDGSILKSRGSAAPGLIRIMAMPSTWKLSREWREVKGEDSSQIVYPAAAAPPEPAPVPLREGNVWKLTLAWSQEALNQAAYEMTFWYMAQVGAGVYAKQPLPKGWEGMAPEEAGYNAIKMMLYYILLRKLSNRHLRLATRLYNVYCFGYPLGVDSDEMLWPEDLRDKGGARKGLD